MIPTRRLHGSTLAKQRFPMRHLILASIIAVILLGLGVYHGLATDRWSNPSDDSPGKPFATMPLTIGDWKGEILPRDSEDDAKTSVINTRYTHAISGRWVVTSLTSGRSGRVSIHN